MRQRLDWWWTSGTGAVVAFSLLGRLVAASALRDSMEGVLLGVDEDGLAIHQIRLYRFHIVAPSKEVYLEPGLK